MSETLLNAGEQINAALAPLERAGVYALIAGFFHKYLDVVDEAEMRMLVMFTVTHALESRAAMQEGREPNFNTYTQLSRWAKVESDASGVRFTVTLSATMDHAHWDAAHRAAEAAQGHVFPRKAK